MSSMLLIISRLLLLVRLFVFARRSRVSGRPGLRFQRKTKENNMASFLLGKPLALVLNEKKHSILQNNEWTKIIEETGKWIRESWQ